MGDVPRTNLIVFSSFIQLPRFKFDLISGRGGGGGRQGNVLILSLVSDTVDLMQPTWSCFLCSLTIVTPDFRSVKRESD